jgi:hypothetical protein
MKEGLSMKGLTTAIPEKPSRFLSTDRIDLWWIQPLGVWMGLTLFICYSLWAVWQGAHYFSGPYLSPFYCPELFGDSPHSLFGPKPAWYPGWLHYSPPFFVIWIPVGIRFTCYYFRGAYYKAFWADPVACTVGEPRSKYRGENSFPLIMQNIHRYFIFFAMILIAFHAQGAFRAFWFANPVGGSEKFGVGVGSIVLACDCIFLCFYIFGCHSLRHFAGGCCDKLSGRPIRKALYGCSCSLNRFHMPWAWISLFWIGFTDLYIRLCAMGIIKDWRLF